jgi:hypothetical protein
LDHGNVVSLSKSKSEVGNRPLGYHSLLSKDINNESIPIFRLPVFKARIHGLIYDTSS